MTYAKKKKQPELNFSKVKKVPITTELVKDAVECYQEIEEIGIDGVLRTKVDAKLLFTFLIYFFEQREEYEKCAFLKKMYDTHL